ncbi:probable chitinase 10 isoform X2 [Drosophila sulfurigaster albostrigata]|uniref:probable chitinase 10 isoform X2 n=1 Tax=Drosophila sulfurigaster albostrigata TaxID=89887 RepID=UPI002D21980C|nr:probable chitinase 10 isoform X2 [Drosophila sulfurigaster albostrigata]
MAYISTFLVILLLDSTLTASSQLQWMRKPTNSVTIRQSAGGLCANHLAGSFVEHAEDCRLFYLCMERGDAVLASCPSTMLFNADNKICDAPENVRCTNSSSNTGSGGTSNPPPSASDNDLNNMVTDAATYCATLTPQPENDRIVYIGSSTSCNNYYICYYGQAIPQTCSAELHWNAVTAKCDLPERAQCTLETPPNTPPADSTNISNELIHCPPHGQHLYPHMRRCEFFIYCVKGYATLQQCPFYYYFDVFTKSCQWSRTAICARDLNFARH